MASLNFNANEVDPSTGGGPIPPGAYEFHVIEADLKPAQSGNGDVLSLVFEVLSGEFQGRKVYERMNVRHNNPVAQKIGQEALSALCHATGKMQIADTEELLWATFTAETKIDTYKKQDGSTGEGTAIKRYRFGGDQAPPETKAQPSERPAPRTQPQTSGGRQGGASVPWGKR